MYQYPYGNAQQLNLDWILNKLKELETEGVGLNLEDVSNALIALNYNSSTNYRRYDYAFKNNKLYRCLTDTTGAFDPAAWMEVRIGEDIPVLTRLLNAVDASLTTLQNQAVIQVQDKTAGYNTLDNIVDHALAQITAGMTSYGKLFTFRTNNGTGIDPNEYFGNSRVYVICNFQQYTYGCGLLLSDSNKNIAAFIRRNGVNTLYPIGDFQTEIDNLNGALKGAANKHKYVFISDSYGVGITAGGTTDGLAVLIQQGLGLSNTEFYQNCVGGSGFIGNVTATFITQLASVAASIPDANKPEITDVIFCGGYNDRMKTSSALNTAIQTAATNARAFFPNAKLWIVMAGFSTDVNGTSRSKLQDLQQIYSTYGQQNGMAFIGANMALKMHRSLMSSDTVHPSSGGYVIQSGYIMTVLLGGIPLQYYGGNVATLSAVENETAPKYTSLTQRFNNNQIVTIYPSNLDTFDIENRSTKPSNMSWYKLANISNELGQGFGSTDTGADWGSAQVNCILRFSSGGNVTYKEATGIVSINHGGLFIKLTNVEGGSWMTYTNLTNICIKACSTYVPVEAVC